MSRDIEVRGHFIQHEGKFISRGNLYFFQLLAPLTMEQERPFQTAADCLDHLGTPDLCEQAYILYNCLCVRITDQDIVARVDNLLDMFIESHSPRLVNLTLAPVLDVAMDDNINRCKLIFYCRAMSVPHT